MNENQMPDWEKIARDLAFQFADEIKGDIDPKAEVLKFAEGLIVDFKANTDYLKPTPPDALVEAVKEIDWDGEIEQALIRMNGNYTDGSHEIEIYRFGIRDGLLESKEIVEIALQSDAHKKAVP